MPDRCFQCGITFDREAFAGSNPVDLDLEHASLDRGVCFVRILVHNDVSGYDEDGGQWFCSPICATLSMAFLAGLHVRPPETEDEDAEVQRYMVENPDWVDRWRIERAVGD